MGSGIVDALLRLRKDVRVAFLGDSTKAELFGDRDAVGKTVLINQMPFTVVGVMTRKVQMGNYSGQDKDHVLIPLSTFKSITGRRTLSNFVIINGKQTLQYVR